jgi:RNA polymerase sigma-70 factor (ECF subfamily)
MLEQTRQSHTSDTPSVQHTKRVVDSVPPLGELPDLLLVERTRSRDMRAFETLMRRYNRRLFRIARSILNDDEAAEEAVRAAHVRAFANLDRYEPAGKFGAWLARLAFNEALTLRKNSLAGAAATERRDRSATMTTRSVNSGTIPAHSGMSGAPVNADEADLAANRQLLEKAIDGLPEVFRTVLVLRVVEDLSGVDVAVCLGLHETTVRTRLYRAQQRLKVDVARRLRAEPSNIFDLSPESGDHIVSQVFARLHSTPLQSEAR